MKKLFLVGSFLIFSNLVFLQSKANELDDEKSVSNQELQGTVVVRVDTRNNSAAYVKSDVQLSNERQAQVIAHSSNYVSLASANIRSELDKDAGSSSWYFYYNFNYGYNYGYNYNYFYWYGNYYNPFYTYNYGYYQYYYYCRNGGWY
jgi:hypothetical protein